MHKKKKKERSKHAPSGYLVIVGTVISSTIILAILMSVTDSLRILLSALFLMLIVMVTLLVRKESSIDKSREEKQEEIEKLREKWTQGRQEEPMEKTLKPLDISTKPSKLCLEAINKAYTSDFRDDSERIEAFEKAISLASTKTGRREIYKDMVYSGLSVGNFRKAVDEKIINLMTHLARLYEDAYQFSKAEKILQQVLTLDEGSYVATKAMSDILLKQGNIDGAIELWKEKIKNSLTADTRWLKDAQKKKRERYSFHPKPSTIEKLKTLVDQGIIPKEQYHYRKESIMEKQQTRKLKEIEAVEGRTRNIEIEALYEYYCIKDSYGLSYGILPATKSEFPKEIREPGYWPNYEKLTPEQRWIYHEWLKNKVTIVGIGYVFVRLAELIGVLFHENYETDKVRNEMKFLLELYRDNESFRSYGLEALRLSYFVEEEEFSQERILYMTQSAISGVSVAFFHECGLDYKWGKEVPQKLKRYLHKLLDKYREEVDFCNLISYRLAETYYASEECEKALLAVKTISKPGYRFMPIEIAIETRCKLNESLAGYELLAAAGINNNYYYYTNGKKITERVEMHAGEGDWIRIESPVKAETTYHFSKFTAEHFDAIAIKCEKKLRKWEKNQGQNVLQYTAEIYDKDPSFTSSGNNFMFAKEFIKSVVKIAYEAENEIREEMDYPPIGKPSLTETKLYQLVKSVFKGYEVIRHARPSFLQRQHLDIYIPKLKLAIEYQGEQHFKPIDLWGGVEGLKTSQERDEKKREVCKRHGIAVSYFSFKDEVSGELVRNRLKDYLAS